MKLKRIVQGLSGYSKPPKPEPQHLNMSDLLAATRELVAHEARKPAGDLQFSWASGLAGLKWLHGGQR